MKIVQNTILTKMRRVTLADATPIIAYFFFFVNPKNKKIKALTINMSEPAPQYSVFIFNQWGGRPTAHLPYAREKIVDFLSFADVTVPSVSLRNLRFAVTL